MVDQLQRLPVSAERDRMLREVRARIVDVDTGVPPGPLLPVHPDSTAAPGPRSRTTQAPSKVAPRPAYAGPGGRRATGVPEPAKPVQVPPRNAVAPANARVAAYGSFTGAGDRLAIEADELLSLDDSSFSPIEGQAEPAAAPWRYGLRG
jgi:hypothetical protein